jgi:hypothetical protein
VHHILLSAHPIVKSHNVSFWQFCDLGNVGRGRRKAQSAMATVGWRPEQLAQACGHLGFLGRERSPSGLPPQRALEADPMEVILVPIDVVCGNPQVNRSTRPDLAADTGAMNRDEQSHVGPAPGYMRCWSGFRQG